jgi:hypothetical protein
MFLQVIFVVVVLVLDVAGIVYCLNDLYQPDRRVTGAKDIWAIIIIIAGPIGWILYFSYGRVNP